MGISWQGDNLTITMQKAGKALEDKIKADAHDMLPRFAEMGKEQMQHKIWNTPSAIISKDNRFWSGQMHNDISTTPVTSPKPNVYEIDFGWPPFGTPGYFMMQDHGGWTDEVFLWNYQWGYISPMHSLLEAHLYTSQEFIREAIRRWG